jgi:hypothetical protein
VPHTTIYANVDLVLKASEDLSLLVAAFGEHVMELNAGRMPRNEAILEVHHRGGPEGAINAFCDLVASLSPQARALWERCKERTFDVGFVAGLEPWPFRSTIGPETLARAAQIGATLAISIYGYRSEGGK